MANFLRSTGEHDGFHYGRLEQEAVDTGSRLSMDAS
jgi:hypothetical protein